MNDGKICVSVCAGTADEMIAYIRRAEEFADVVEVRFDCLEASEIRFVVDALPEIRGAYLFTLRPKDQGGKRELTLSERLKFWELIFSRQREHFMIDIEGESSMLLAIRPRSVERIVSMHDFDGVPENLDGCFDVLASFDGNVVKIAVACDDSVDAISVWKLIEKAKAAGKQIIPIAMGEAGKWTRILGLAHGAFLTYASLDLGKETAGGQLTAKDLIDVYRVKELNAETKVYAVIGDPISQSLSPFLHNPAFAAAGDNAVFIHLLVKNIDEFITRMVNPATREIDLNFGGFAVTMPHKESIIKHLDAIDPVAENIGAVNTINIENGMVVGYNTDAYGFITPLKETFGDLRDSRVAILGAGGTTRACIYALKNEGADVTVFVRDKAKAAMFSSELAIAVKQLPLSIVDRDNLPVNSFDILINATPIGMPGALELESLFTAQELLGVKLVYDLVTKPTDTPLIAEAKKAGIPTIGGIEMLIAQGARQFEIWMGREAPIELMRASVLARMNGEAMSVEALNCPNCGAGVDSDRTQCQFCKTRLKTVGCPKCLGQMFVGSKFCGHCGAIAAPVEVSLDESAGDCPRCRQSLETLQIDETSVRACTKCDGVWLAVATFETICADGERQSAVLGFFDGRTVRSQPLTKVNYVPCPDCCELMNRNNFAKASGVIVDLCKQHGVWFDADELPSIIEFIRKGGMELARKREKNDIDQERDKLRDDQRRQAAQDNRFGTGNIFDDRDESGIRGFVRSLFS